MPVPRFVLGDVLRWAALLSVVVALPPWGWVGGALFFLVLGGCVIPRALEAPAALDLSYCALLLFGAWAAQLDLYLRVGWLDVVVHAAATGLIAAMAYLALVRLGALSLARDPATPRWRLGRGVVTLALGTSLAVVWEMCEWFGHTQIDDRIQVGYADTMGDLVAGGVGSAVAAVLLARGLLLAGARR
ncbi:hypothetical protein LRP67_20330 [Nocardioides sp. cx-169]|uniref:hypothetical protein n=1 Tax=Nocardioides sp. cx-169 TaxID=2899080 RepID=UPI001E3D881E|nr:hypothetical protein [Nocardioides sp. cx-169]MCD4536448.1 hypothetical protein [Nocardioides sp. cx-169]